MMGPYLQQPRKKTIKEVKAKKVSGRAHIYPTPSFSSKLNLRVIDPFALDIGVWNMLFYRVPRWCTMRAQYVQYITALRTQ